MNPEQAILQLKNRAENLSARATTYQQRMEAEELARITNTIIDYYNQAEHQTPLLKNAFDTIQVLCEYIGINQSDIDILKEIDATFLRKRLLCRIDSEDDSYLLFHRVCTDNHIIQSMNSSIASSKECIRMIENIQELSPENYDLLCSMKKQLAEEQQLYQIMTE